MAWYSLLPPELEIWAVRIFLFLGILTTLPWATLLLFDFTFYIWRLIAWEVPVIGGRARGRQRPRAPSLHERPDGQRRGGVVFGLGGSREGSVAGSREGSRSRMESETEAKGSGFDEKEGNGDGEVKRRGRSGAEVG